MQTIPKRLQLDLTERHQRLIEETMDMLALSKREVILRAIEGVHKMAMMQSKREKESRPKGAAS